MIIFFAGRLPLARAVRGNVSDDPRVDIEHDLDPQTYRGLLRISTGMAILSGIAELQALAPRINVPICIFHGSNDRATSPQGSKDFFQKVSSKDKTLKIWDGYEHVMMKNVPGEFRLRNKVIGERNLIEFSHFDPVLSSFSSQEWTRLTKRNETLS